MNVVKVLWAALLIIVALAILLAVILPAVSLILGLGIDIPNAWARSGRILFFYAHPWLSLLIGFLLLAVFGWGVWKLARG